MHALLRFALVLALAVPTTAAGQAIISVDDVAGEAGKLVAFDVSLIADAAEVVATENELHFEEGAAVVSCRANEDIGKDATLFTYLPRDCQRGVDCDSVRILVFSFTNTDAIPTGSVLYSCTVSIAPSIPPESLLTAACSEPGASTAAGLPLATECRDGSITVIEPVVPPCIGDCDDDRQVVVSELLTGVNLLLGRASLERCPAFDRDLNEVVSVDELVAGTGEALHGCPQ